MAESPQSSHRQRIGTTQRSIPQQSIDGWPRPPEVEEELNDLAAATFSSANAQKFLGYLRSITINAIDGPEATDSHLRHKEGMRTLYAIIDGRINAAHQQRQRKAQAK